MKLWIDDIRPSPKGYVRCKTVDQVITILEAAIEWQNGHEDVAYSLLLFAQSIGANFPMLCNSNQMDFCIEELNLDYDAGFYVKHGGQYINILYWMEEHKVNIPVKIHSINPIGRKRMTKIAKRNGWLIDINKIKNHIQKEGNNYECKQL